MHKRSFVKLLAMVVLASWAHANAQEYPTRPIRVIVGAAAGSGTDLAPRIVSQKLSERLGWTIVVENRPGGDYVIATQATVDAPPDGYTLFSAASVTTIMPFAQKNLPFDFLRDLQPITRITALQSAIWVANNVPVQTFNELLQWGRENPGKMNVGGSGNANPLRFAFEAIRLKTKLPGEYISYKTGATVVTDLASGNVPIGLTGIGNAAPFQREGKMKIVLILSQNRSSVYPDIPSMKDIGVDGATGDAWLGFLTRAGTPATVVARLHKEIVAAVQLPEMKVQFNKIGMDPAYDASPEDFRKYLQNEITANGNIIKAIGLKFE